MKRKRPFLAVALAVGMGVDGAHAEMQDSHQCPNYWPQIEEANKRIQNIDTAISQLREQLEQTTINDFTSKDIENRVVILMKERFKLYNDSNFAATLQGSCIMYELKKNGTTVWKLLNK